MYVSDLLMQAHIRFHVELDSRRFLSCYIENTHGRFLAAIIWQAQVKYTGNDDANKMTTLGNEIHVRFT